MVMEPANKLYQGRTTLRYMDYITGHGNSKALPVRRRIDGFQYERL
jgi:hypothetical protein